MMKLKRIIFVVALVLLTTGLWTGLVSAQEPTPSADDVNRIAKQLFCPVCENTPLDVCPTTACAQWRELIRQKLAEGWTDEQIKQYFVDQYGARVLSEPPRTGLNWLVYIVPVVLFLAGVVVLVLALLSMRAPVTQDSPPSAGEIASETASSDGTDDPYLSRMEEELRNHK
jgi:cytochrome c-type biogenesis protein CcmH